MIGEILTGMVKHIDQKWYIIYQTFSMADNRSELLIEQFELCEEDQEYLSLCSIGGTQVPTNEVNFVVVKDEITARLFLKSPYVSPVAKLVAPIKQPLTKQMAEPEELCQQMYDEILTILQYNCQPTLCPKAARKVIEVFADRILNLTEYSGKKVELPQTTIQFYTQFKEEIKYIQ